MTNPMVPATITLANRIADAAPARSLVSSRSRFAVSRRSFCSPCTTPPSDVATAPEALLQSDAAIGSALGLAMLPVPVLLVGASDVGCSNAVASILRCASMSGPLKFAQYEFSCSAVASAANWPAM